MVLLLLVLCVNATLRFSLFAGVLDTCLGRVVRDGCTPPHPVAQGGGPKPKVMFPWMSLEGEVNLRLLNRTRQALVAYVRSNPGCQAADVR